MSQLNSPICLIPPTSNKKIVHYKNFFCLSIIYIVTLSRMKSYMMTQFSAPGAPGKAPPASGLGRSVSPASSLGG